MANLNVFLLAAFITGSTPALAEAGANNGSASTGDVQAAAPAKSAEAPKAKTREKKVCTRMTPLTGSLTPKKVCRTVSEPEKTQE